MLVSINGVLWLVWIGLGVCVLAAAGGIALAVIRALQFWRDLKRVRRTLLRGLHAFEERALALADNAGRERPTPELERSLARLRHSTARLAVLRSALDDATDAVGRVTAVYPRK